MLKRAPAVVRRALPPVIFAVAALGAWQLYVAVSGVSNAILPSPTEIVSAVWIDRGLLLSNGLVTLEEIVLGYLVAAVVGFGLAVLLSLSRVAERAVYPWLVVSQTIPVIAIAPIVIVWTDFGIRPKLIVIALVTFFPIAVNAVDGLRSTDPELLALLRTLGAGRWQRFRVAQLPASLPFVFSGLKVAAALAVIGAVFAEWAGASSGLGWLVLIYNNQGGTATADMFAAIAALSVIGVALFFAVLALERVLLPWYHEPRGGEHLGGAAG